MTDAEWEVLEPKVPAVKDGGRPAQYPRRDIVDAIFYVNRTGCSWHSLPIDFPHWMTIYSYFREWRRSGVYERINDAFRVQVRDLEGKNAVPTAAIIVPTDPPFSEVLTLCESMMAAVGTAFLPSRSSTCLPE